LLFNEENFVFQNLLLVKVIDIPVFFDQKNFVNQNVFVEQRRLSLFFELVIFQ
jgi:hypothetical protein